MVPLNGFNTKAFTGHAEYALHFVYKKLFFAGDDRPPPPDRGYVPKKVIFYSLLVDPLKKNVFPLLSHTGLIQIGFTNVSG